jgi:hypothetical protein
LAQNIGAILLKVNRNFFAFWKNIENRVAWFLAELCKAEKGVQKEKRNQRRAELARGCLAPRTVNQHPPAHTIHWMPVTTQL